MWFISTFYWRLASNASKLLGPPLIGSTAVTTHAAVTSDARSSLLRIFEYAAKQAWKQVQCNKAKLLEPASINGLHNIRVYATASLLSAYTNENRGGHIYTVTASRYQNWAPDTRWIYYQLWYSGIIGHTYSLNFEWHLYPLQQKEIFTLTGGDGGQIVFPAALLHMS